MTHDPLELLRADHPLGPMTTIGTGGPARHFARVGTRAELPALLAWARGEREPVFVLGSGSNLLVADEGVDGLVIKLDRALAAISVQAPRLVCGGGARLPAVAARSAREGLSGIEFGVNIPGTLGGAVRMNANAYGGELARVLEWVEIAGPDGYERRLPQELGFSYRDS
ncbi:MAG TPA: FAD-binding protein, partial [Solirubrobacteraceae bacterium]|nr:FAD-binding protein [Solirubrobacteraceae bacterium]